MASCFGYILNIFNLFQSVRSFVRLLCVAFKNRYLIGRRNDVTANMAALAVCMCLAASHLLDTLRSSVWVSYARRALVQKFTVFYGARELLWLSARGYFNYCVSLLGYFSCQRSGLLKALSLWRRKLLGQKLAWLRHCRIGYGKT